MATVSTVLTDTFQQVSAGECFAQIDGSVCMGFGSVSPTVFHVVNDTRDGTYRDINYNGNYGAMWMKKLNGTTTNVNVIVTQA